jgi:hypothetical protein
MMSDDAWLTLVLLSGAAFFIIAGLTVKTFRYKYGGFKVPKMVGGTVFVGVGVILAWMAIMFAVKS